MSEPLLTKRLHISGLTPSITPTELERRLSVFGKVKAMDGFGARDGLGDPRKFGFVTMEIGTKELAKCLNVLSGSTWKGAKLRIGEAKPDFRERIAQMNAQPAKPIRQRRTPRNHGRPSSTLPLIPLSTTTAAATPGWIVTPSGRVVRPMRIRPDRPLDPTRTELTASKGKAGKVKKRVKPPPVRARRRLIDPTKWDSVYLKGVYLDAIEVPMPKAKEVTKEEEEEAMESESEEDEKEGNDESDDASDSDADEPSRPPPQPVQAPLPVTTSAQQSQTTASVPTSAHVPEATGSIDIREEASAALAMLGNMFGDHEDWGGSESVDEMEGLGMTAEANENAIQVDGEDDIEIVPRDPMEGEATKTTKKDKKKSKGKEKAVDDAVLRESEQPRDRDMETEEAGPSVSDHASSSQIAPAAPQASLKALFAPREEASFSLVDHLDLDLELEDDILGLGVPAGPSQVENYASQTTVPMPQAVLLSSTTSKSKARDRVTLDPSYPLLFPLPESLPYPYASSSTSSKTSHSQNTPNCILFPPRTTPPRHLSHLHFLPPAHTFSRSPDETSETIRERWEREKVALTREWKKASREARGSRRAKADRALPDIHV